MILKRNAPASFLKIIILMKAALSEAGQSTRETGLKRTPASIYWNGPRTYHIFKSEITLNQYLKAIASRKSLKENIAKTGQSQ